MANIFYVQQQRGYTLLIRGERR